MDQDNLSAVLYGIDDIRLEQRPIPKPKAGQLLVRVHTVGLCGSDTHLLKEGRIGHHPMTGPIILGHETSGTVVEVGEEVNGFSVGDRVTLEPGVSCRMCNEQCKPGRYNLCPNQTVFILPPTDGTLTRWIAYDADFCHKMPEGMSFEEGALMEPLSVGVHTVTRAGITLAQRVLITGAGPIGTVCMLAAKAQGAGPIVVTDVDEHRLEMVKQLGADFVINVQGKSVEDVRKEVISILGREPDTTIECTGAESAVSTGIMTTKRGGVLALVGIGGLTSSVPLVEAVLKELEMKGVVRYKCSFPVSIDMVASGRIDLKGLTTAHYPLEEVNEAFERQQKGDVMKVFVHL